MIAAPRAPVNNSGKSCSCILIILYADLPSFNWNSKKNPKHPSLIKFISGQIFSQHYSPANYISLQPSQPALHIWFSEGFFRHPATVVNTWTWLRSKEAPEKCLGPKVFPLSMSKCYVKLPISLHAQQTLKNAGADPGEVKWVNFHPPFFWAPFFLSFSYPSNIDWFYYIITKIHPPFQNPGSENLITCIWLLMMVLVTSNY